MAGLPRDPPQGREKDATLGQLTVEVKVKADRNKWMEELEKTSAWALEQTKQDFEEGLIPASRYIAVIEANSEALRAKLPFLQGDDARNAIAQIRMYGNEIKGINDKLTEAAFQRRKMAEEADFNKWQDTYKSWNDSLGQDRRSATQHHYVGHGGVTSAVDQKLDNLKEQALLTEADYQSARETQEKKHQGVCSPWRNTSTRSANSQSLTRSGRTTDGCWIAPRKTPNIRRQSSVRTAMSTRAHSTKWVAWSQPLRTRRIGSNNSERPSVTVSQKR
ncbi:MAG: hypothetical protein IPF79_04540 [Ignavibacteria bacterium]|nr:hypothetical protein [Ignavibacteria bacterium]